MNLPDRKLKWSETGGHYASEYNGEGPLVSVIIPCYNRQHHLQKTLECLTGQSHEPLEIILVDDASESNLLNTVIPLLAHFTGNWRIVRLEKNSGPGVARRLGHSLAKGSYLQFLDSDDVITKDKITVQTAFLENNQELIMTYGLSHYLENRDAVEAPRILGRTDKKFHRILPEALKGIIWQTSSCLWRSNAVKFENWKALYCAEDILFDILTGLEDRPIAKTPGNTPLTFKRVDNTGLSHSLVENEKAQLDILKAYDIFRKTVEIDGAELKEKKELMEQIARRYLGKIMTFLVLRNSKAVVHCMESVLVTRPELLPPDARAAFYIYRIAKSTAGFVLLRKWRWLQKKVRNSKRERPEN